MRWYRPFLAIIFIVLTLIYLKLADWYITRDRDCDIRDTIRATWDKLRATWDRIRKKGTEDNMLDYLFVFGLSIIFILYGVITDHICNGSDKSDRN